MAEAVLKINGRNVINTFKGLSAEAVKLRRQLKGITPGTEAFIKKAEEVKNVERAFKKVKDEINAVQSAATKSGNILHRVFDTLAGSVLNIARGITLAGIFNGFLGKAGQSINKLLELSDTMSAVRKTTGLTQKEVKELWDEFGDVNTRTPKEELMKIAEMAGRLGIKGKQNIKDFTTEIDKAYVALGDSFGGSVEEVATKLGKIKNLFSDTKEKSYAEAIKGVGSALNELAANGTSSEANISDFTLRIGQLPDVLKPSIQATLGLGAAFEESGVDAQIASSGYSRFISTAATNLPKFAKSMNISIEQARELINTKPDEFFLKFAESSKNLDSEGLAKKLESLKLNSLEVRKAVGSAAGNIDRFRSAIELSGKSMSEMTSLQNEFNEVNENAAAIWDKIKKKIANIFTDGKIFNYFEGLIKWVGDFVGVTEKARKKGVDFAERLAFLAKTIGVVTTALVSYNLAKKLSIALTKKNIQTTILANAAEKIQAIRLGISRGATLLYAGAKALLTGNIKRATAAMRLFNLTTKMNPLGLLIGVITAAYTAYKLFSNNVDEATKKQKELNVAQSISVEQSKEATKEINNLKSKIDPLIKILNDENTTLDLRKRAYQALISIAPEFKGTIDEEYKATDKLVGVYDTLIQKLNDVATAKAWQNIREKRAQELAEAQAEEFEAKLKADKEAEKYAEAEKHNKNIEKAAKGGGIYVTSYGTTIGNNDFVKRETKTDERRNYLKKKRETEEKLKLQNDFLAYQQEIIKKKEEELQNLKKEGAKEELIKAKQNEINSLLGVNTSTNTNTGTGGTGDDNKKDAEKRAKEIERAGKEALKIQEKWDKELQKSRDKNWDIRHSLEAENWKKEYDKIEENTQRKLRALEEEGKEIIKEKQKYEAEISKLEKERLKANPAQKATIDDAISKYKTSIENMEDILKMHQERKINIERSGNMELQKMSEKYRKKIIENQSKELEETLKKEKRKRFLEIDMMKASEAEKKQLRKQYEKEDLLQRIKFLKETHATLKEAFIAGDAKKLGLSDMVLSESDKEILKGRLAELGVSLEDINVIMSQIKGGGDFKGVGIVGNADIFGMSAEQWETMFNNLDKWQGKVEIVVSVTRAIQQVWGEFHNLQMRKEQESLRHFEKITQQRKDILQKQLTEGYINQKQHDEKVKQLDDEVAHRRAEMEYKQAKFDKRNAIINSIINTALGVSAALSRGPIGIALAAVVGALGAAQTAMISAQPLPSPTGYAKGGPTLSLGFKDETGHEVAGIVHADEYVIPKWMRKQPEVARVEQWLEAKRIGKTQTFESGGATSNINQIAPERIYSKESSNESNQLLMVALMRNTEVIEKLQEEGIRAYVVADERAGKEFKKSIESYNILKNKNKK